MIVRFTVPGEPKGKGRPRFTTTQSGKTFARTPKDTIQYENLVKWYYSTLGENKPLQGQIRADIKAYYQKPKSMTKKNLRLVEEGKLRPTKKPDLDNVAKAILDSLNTIAYHDDSQVVELYIEKLYADEQGPRVEVKLTELESDD